MLDPVSGPGGFASKSIPIPPLPGIRIGFGLVHTGVGAGVLMGVGVGGLLWEVMPVGVDEAVPGEDVSDL